MKTFFLYIAIFLSFTLHSCIEKPVYPSTPVITYKDFIRYGNSADPDSVELVVSFTDNEGDIGLDQDDTFGIFSVGNIFMDYMYWDTIGVDHWSYYDNTPASPIPFDTLKIAFRVPPVLPPGDPAEPMKGLIYVKQLAPVNIYPKIKYVVYLYDKARNKSDTIHTPPIIF